VILNVTTSNYESDEMCQMQQNNRRQSLAYDLLSQMTDKCAVQMTACLISLSAPNYVPTSSILLQHSAVWTHLLLGMYRIVNFTIRPEPDSTG